VLHQRPDALEAFRIAADLCTYRVLKETKVTERLGQSADPVTTHVLVMSLGHAEGQVRA
jgi:hypothetical protein